MAVPLRQLDELALTSDGGSLSVWSTDERRARSLYTAVCVALGLLLLAAGLLKGYQLATEPIRPWVLLGTLLVVAFEMQLGCWLLLGPRSRWTWRVAFGCFCVFTSVTAYKALAGMDSCGCFGALRVHPWVTLVFDVAAVVGLVSCRTQPAPVAAHTSAVQFIRPVAAGAVITLFVAVAAGARQSQIVRLDADAPFTASGNLVLLEPDKWIGMQFPLLDHLDIDADLSMGSWTVLLIHDGCPVCRDVMLQLEEALRAGADVPLIALISLDHTSGNEITDRLCDLGCALGQLPPDKEWFATTPVRVHLVDGTCIEAGCITNW